MALPASDAAVNVRPEEDRRLVEEAGWAQIQDAYAQALVKKLAARLAASLNDVEDYQRYVERKIEPELLARAERCAEERDALREALERIERLGSSRQLGPIALAEIAGQALNQAQDKSYEDICREREDFHRRLG